MFKRQFAEKILRVQSNFQTSAEERERMSKVKFDPIKHEIIRGIIKEIEPHITIKESMIHPTRSYGVSNEPDKIHSSTVFFMNEETMEWLIIELNKFFDDVQRQKL